ncbi:xanthine dehydrogenase family protein molybdopterin-binding subunit [Thermoproteota archaeon]
MPKIGEIKEVTWENKPPTRYVGKYIEDIDARSIVTGKIEYCEDIEYPGILYGKVKRSTVPHGKILKIDTTAAKNLLGVVDVFTADDIGRVHVFGDEPVLAYDKVRYYGEPVACVVAETDEIAENAIELIKVEYEELPALFDPEEAASLTPPIIINKPKPVISEIEDERPNLVIKTQVRKGDVDKAFAECDYVVENVYNAPTITHAATEPHNAVADYDAGADHLTAWESTQCVFGVHHPVIAGVVGMPGDKVTFITPRRVGGGFGGKNMPLPGIQVAWMAKRTGKAVKCVLSREDSHLVVSRPAWRVYMKDGVNKDGIIKARKMTIYCGAGPFVRFNNDLARKAETAPAGTYDHDNFWWDCYLSFTNDQPMLSLRGFSIPEMNYAYESHMDVVARKIGMDPVEFRKKNVLPQGKRNVLGEIQGGINVGECLDKVADGIGLGTAKPSLSGPWKRGRGIAASNMYCDAGVRKPVAIVKLNGDSTVDVTSSAVEVGHGIFTCMAAIAADALNIDIEKVQILTPNSDTSTFTGMSNGSQQAFHAGGAVYYACLDAKKKLFEAAASILEAKTEDLETENGYVFVKGNPENSIEWGKLMPGSGGGIPVLIGVGEIWIGVDGYDQQTGQTTPVEGEPVWDRRYALYGHAAEGVELDINTDTGEIRVVKQAQCIDSRPINLPAVESHLVGGMVFGFGPGLSEEQIHDKGRYLNLTFLDYKMFTSLDSPGPSNVYIDYAPHTGPQIMGRHDTPGSEGPFYGGRGNGEQPVVPTMAAIANAIEDGIGIRMTDAPFTPSKVLQALGKF